VVLEDPLQAVGAAAIVFFLLLGGLYLLDPSITAKVWLGLIFVMVGIMILLILVGAWSLGAIIIGAIGAFAGRVLLDRLGVAQ